MPEYHRLRFTDDLRMRPMGAGSQLLAPPALGSGWSPDSDRGGGARNTGKQRHRLSDMLLAGTFQTSLGHVAGRVQACKRETGPCRVS